MIKKDKKQKQEIIGKISRIHTKNNNEILSSNIDSMYISQFTPPCCLLTPIPSRQG